MGFLSILKSIFHAVCGSSSATETPQQGYPGQAHHQQQQHHQQQPSPGHFPPQQGYPQHQAQPHKPPAAQPHKPSGKPHKPYVNDNEINTANEHYSSLRAKANEQGDAMSKCFQQGHEAYSRGDGALAKDMSNKGKEHQRKMEEYNKQASDWIFRANNLDSAPDEIDLHGLYVKEAIARTEDALEKAKRNGDTEIKLIVGKGLHSTSGAKIKPAIENLMKKYQLDAELDPHNAGVLVVRLDGDRRRSHMGADEITRRLERGNEDGCTIM